MLAAAARAPTPRRAPRNLFGKPFCVFPVIFLQQELAPRIAGATESTSSNTGTDKAR